MKRIPLIGLLMILSMPLSHAKNEPWYMGVIAGFMDADTGLMDDAINGGFDIGYQHNRYLSSEFEYTRTFIDGETPSGNDWEVDTMSIYAAFRSNTKIKFKGKVGLTDIDYGNNSDTEISLGIGIGFWALGGLTEIEYTSLGDSNNTDLDFLSIGVKYFF